MAPIVVKSTSTLFVVGTDTGVGKTVVAALLGRAAAGRGRVRYWKPVQTGAESDTREVERLAAGCALEFAEPAYRFELPASPHEAAAAEGTTIRMERLDARLDGLLATPGTLIVELAGGLLVPLEEGRLQIDWLASRRPPLVLVARSGLGTLNHTLLSIEALEARGLVPRALVLVGRPHPSNRATLERRTSLPVVEVPPFEPLDPAILDDWLAGHDLTFLLA
jgi:dethiobiotin synthase